MTKYRELDPQELISEGDEWLTPSGTWKKTINVGKTPRSLCNPYRRPMPEYFPEWKYDKAPGCPVHVLWAETPVGTPLVAPDVSGATPRASESIPEPGEGYRLLVHGVDVRLEGDEAWQIISCFWDGICPPYGGRLEPLTTYRRKIRPALKYRPYADASEAASALQGKLFHMPNSRNWWTVLSISQYGVSFGDDFEAFSEFCAEYVFTDGTPCGIQIND